MSEIHSHGHIDVFPGERHAVHIELTFGAALPDDVRESIAHAVAVLVEARIAATLPEETVLS